MLELANTAGADEGSDGVEIISTGDTDDGDVLAELSLNSGDRTGLPLTRGSPRSPEPEHQVLAR